MLTAGGGEAIGQFAGRGKLENVRRHPDANEAREGEVRCG